MFMFQKFLEYFGENMIFKMTGEPYKDFIESFSGKQFGNGLFTIFKKDDLAKWERNVKDAYPLIKEEISLFGYDWLGNCFGILKNGKVALFEIGTAQILLMEKDFLEFINNEVPAHSEACFASQFYKGWLQNGGMTVKYGRCVGYKIPLFMGGKDDILNLEETDLDVYWTVFTQVMDKIGVVR